MNKQAAFVLSVALICSGLASAQIGIISTYAGNDLTGTFPGNGAPATNAIINNPAGLAVDASGNLYIAASGNSLIRQVNATTGIITTVAGSGNGGDGGLATAALLSGPCDMKVDAAGNLYISETCVTASSGNGGGGGTGSGGIARIRRVDAITGIITTVAGTTSSGFAGDGGPATSALLSLPTGLAIDAAGNIFVADSGNNRIRRIDAVTGAISTVAGNGAPTFAGDGGPATSASLNSPAGVTVDANGNLYIADTSNNAIRRVDAVTGIITTVAGTGVGGFSGDGIAATSANLLQPTAVILSGGNVVFVEVGNNRVRTIDNNGIIWTLAGNGSPYGYGAQLGDGGPASLAVLSHPIGLAALPAGPLFISELTGDRVREDSLPSSVAATAVTVSSSAASVGVGQQVTLTATLAATNGPGSNVPGGVVFFDGLNAPATIGNAAIVNGTATITVSLQGTGAHSISAVYPGTSGFGGSYSPYLTVTVGLAPTTVSMTASPNPASANQLVLLTATVSPSSVTGPVFFYNGSTQLGYGSISGGVATLSVTGFVAGTYSLTANFGGDSTHAASTSPAVGLNVKASSSIVVSSSLNPSPAGQSVTFTAAVIPATATGPVQFFDGGTQIGAATIASGTASFSTSALTSGSHSITASYSGDANNSASTSAALTQTVSPKTGTTTTVTSSLSPAPAGSAVTFTAAVSPAAATGTVQFLDGATVLGTGTLASGSASFTTSTLANGSHSITTVYSSDTTYAGSTSAAITQTVQGPAVVALTSNQNPVPVGAPVILTATVSPAAATGTVQFLDGATVLGTATLAGGAASFTTTTLTQGTHSITAVYSGDASDAGATSAPLSEGVRLITGLSLVSSLNPSVVGQTVTFTVNVNPAATGTIQFLDGTAVLSTVTVSSGVAAYSTSSLTQGTHGISVIYSGDTTYLSAQSAAMTQTVNAKAVTVTTVTSGQNPAFVGASVTFTATVSPSAATGSVQFLDGATVLGAGTLAGGSTSFTTSALAQGAHSITAVYAGDSGNAGSTSAVLTQTINARTATTTVLSVSVNPSAVGIPLMFEANVSSGTGTVQFFDGTTSLGTASLVGNAAEFVTSALTQGSHSITAVYSGDAANASSTSAVIAEVVKLNANLNILTSPDPSVVGQTVTFTATVNPAATGTVQFLDGSTVLGTATISGGSTAITISTFTQGAHTLTANYSGDTNYLNQVSFGYTQTVNAKTTTATAVASGANPAFVGAVVTFTASVSPNSATGTVQFLDGGSAMGTGTLANGVASFSTSALAVGAHSISAVYSGDTVNAGSTSAALAETINAKAATSTALTSTPNPAFVTAAVSFTATVSPAAATGTVQFLDGGATLGTGTLANGTAFFTTSTLAQGTHSITAVYSGDAADSGSTSPAVSQAMKLSAGMGVGLNPSPAVQGQTVKITANMNAAATGTVQFTDGATLLATVPVSAGTASYSTASLALGSHTLGVAYSGDTTYMSASTTFPETVIAASTVVVVSNANPSLMGQSVTFTASVTPATATGTVQFYDGGTLVGSASLASGSASVATASLAKGGHSISATYGGDASDGPASATLSQVVRAAASVSLGSSINPSTAGQSVTFTASVTPSAATGAIQFLDGGTVLATVNLTSGAASFSTASLAAGAHSITASYGGDSFDTAAASTVLTQTVNVGAPAAPSNLTATAAGSSQINLGWTASSTSGVTYDVYASTTSGFTPSAANRLASGVASTSYSATGLNVSTTYYFRVTAVNAGGESAATSQASATTAGGFACHVTYSVTDQWNVGFTSALTIQNTGTASIKSWTLTWSWPGNQAVTQSWNATYQQSGANVTLTDESYNKQIAAGATLTGVGFNASYSGANPTPTSFSVNGTLCH